MSDNGINNLIEWPLRSRRKIWLPAALLAVSIPAFTGLWRLWHCSRNFDGMILVPFMCGFILFKNRNKFASSVFKPIKNVLYLLPATTGAMLAAWAYDLPRISGLFLVFNLLAASLGIFGYSNWKLSAVPLIFLLLMIPPPQEAVDFVTVNLQRLFSTIMEFVFSGFSDSFLERRGFEFWFDSIGYPMVIVPECSGIRSLLGFVIMSSFFAVLDRHSIAAAILMITTGAATALVLNFLRIFVTMQMGLGGLEQYTVGSWHGFLGIAVFAVGCVTLSRISRFLKPLNQQNQKEDR
jgi:exosortase